jgi:hypothetical protein
MSRCSETQEDLGSSAEAIQARVVWACAICCGVASLVASRLTLNSIATVSKAARLIEAKVFERGACGRLLLVFMVCSFGVACDRAGQ